MPTDQKPLTERELLTTLKQEKTAADAFVNGTSVAAQRAKNMRYYLDGSLGNEQPGRSAVKSRDVFETVEWIMPQLMEMFTGSNSVVEFTPQGPEDIDAAEQATDYVNYVAMRKNKGFLFLHDWFKDTLLEKNGVGKVYWKENKTPKVQSYTNIDEDELTMLLEPDNVELLEMEETGVQTLAGDDGVARQTVLMDVKVAVIEDEGHVALEVIAPEFTLVRAGTVDLADSDYCGEVFLASYTDLIAAGFPLEAIKQVSFNDNEITQIGDQGRLARGSADGTSTSHTNMGTAHESMRKAIITEAYIRIDANNDGIAELLQVFHTDNVILSQEEVDSHPYLDLTSIRIPHKYHGLAFADVLRDLQEIKTTIMRGIMDHMYATINGRFAVVDGAVNMADLFDPVPGGAVRQSAPGMVEPLITPQLDPQTFSLLEYVDRIKEDRAGVNKLQQGVDKNALGSNVATGAMDTAMRAAQQRIQMLGRLFAETGVKELFYRIYSLVRQHQSKEEFIRLRDEFVPVRPFDWQDRKDMVVTVGTGNVSPADKLAELTLIRDTMAQAVQFGVVKPQDMYNFGVELSKAVGRKDATKFFTEPPENPPPPQPDIDQQIKMEELKLKTAEVELEKEEKALEREKFEWQKLVDMAEIQMEDKQGRPVGLQSGK